MQKLTEYNFERVLIAHQVLCLRRHDEHALTLILDWKRAKFAFKIRQIEGVFDRINLLGRKAHLLLLTCLSVTELDHVATLFSVLMDFDELINEQPR